MSWVESDDFVFAYRLRKITLKRGEEVKNEKYVKGALYSDEVPLVDDTEEEQEYNNLVLEEEEYGAEDADVDVRDIVDEESGPVRLAMPQEEQTSGGLAAGI